MGAAAVLAVPSLRGRFPGMLAASLFRPLRGRQRHLDDVVGRSGAELAGGQPPRHLPGGLRARGWRTCGSRRTAGGRCWAASRSAASWCRPTPSPTRRSPRALRRRRDLRAAAPAVRLLERRRPDGRDWASPGCLWLGARRAGHAAVNALAFPTTGLLIVVMLLSYSRGRAARPRARLRLLVRVDPPAPARLRGPRGRGHRRPRGHRVGVLQGRAHRGPDRPWRPRTEAGHQLFAATAFVLVRSSWRGSSSTSSPRARRRVRARAAAPVWRSPSRSPSCRSGWRPCSPRATADSAARSPTAGAH